MAQGFDLIPQVNVNRKFPEKCSKVGSYIMLETIGVGSTGKVKLCVHIDTLNRYACKIIEKSYVRRQMSSIQIQREIAILSRLRHRNTVSLVSVQSTATRIFIIMELVVGSELYDEVRRLRYVGEPYARFLFRQLVDGLEYCHSHRIFHRDIKPDNLLVDVRRTLKITDFGLAALKGSDDDPESVLESLTLHTRCGTPQYASPEVIKGDASGYSGDKVDMWGCGIILYVLTAGRLPFDSPNADRMASDIIRCDVHYPPNLSDSLVDLIKKLLHPNAKERYTFDDIRRHPWFSCPEPINLNDYPPVSTRVVIGRDPVVITRARQYPYPTGDDAKRRKKLPANNADSDDSTDDGRDSLDFGTRVESVSTEVPLAVLKRLQELQDAQNERDPAADIPTQFEGEQMIEIATEPPPPPLPPPPLPLPLLLPRQDSLSRTLETLVDERNKYHLTMELRDASCDPDDEWADVDNDHVMWCQFTKDVDMIPDICEFGLDSPSLNELWCSGLVKETIHRKKSLAANRFGVRPGTQSHSERDLPLFMNLEAESQFDVSTAPDEQDRVALWSKHFGLESIPSETGARNVVVNGAENQPMSLTDHTVQQGNMTAEPNPEEISMVPVPNASTEVEVLLEQEKASALDDPFAACLPPNIALPAPIEEMADTEYVSRDVIAGPEVSAPQLGSGHFIGIGQDLLEEYDAMDVKIDGNGDMLTNHDMAPVLAADLTQPTAAAETGQATRITDSQATVTTPPATASGGSSTPYSATENNVIHNNPFAIDVPGPRRALPVTSSIVSSFVPSTISQKRFIRKSVIPVDLTSFSQFHSLLDPSSCFDVVLKILREYGCRVRRTSSSRKGEKFQIRCESKKDGATIQTRVRIYKVDDFLCTVRFKRLLQTNSEDFNRFYIDISQLYSEAVKKGDTPDMSDTSLP